MKKPGEIFENFVSGILSLIYSKEKKIERWLVLLIIVGFILRLIAALNLNVLADDMIKAAQSAGIINSGVLSTSSHPALFYYLTDLAYKIFGYTTLASRFWLLISGTLLIPLIFLITKKFFDKKIALASAFFVTFSSFLIRMTFSEESLLVLFFSFFAVYLGMEYLDSKKIKFIVFSGILFGLAILTKYSAPFFILSFLIYAAYYIKTKKEKIFTRQNIKHLILFLIIIFLFAVPFLTFNYLLYKDKGIVDVYFSRIIQLESTQKLYGSLAGQQDSFFDNLFNPVMYHNTTLLYDTDLLLLLFAILGVISMFINKNKKQLVFFFIFLIIPFFLQTGGSSLQKHFAFMHFLAAIPAGLFLNKILNKVNKKSIKILIISVIVILMFINLGTSYGTPQDYFLKSSNSQLKSYINKNVKDSNLIIFDSRIYTARTFWLATPKHLIDTANFLDIYKMNVNLSDSYKQPTEIYVIECVKDDCGWGWVSKDQKFNESIEYIISELTKNTKPAATIYENIYSGNELLSKKEKKAEYNIYKITLLLYPGTPEQIDMINSFYFAPYMYKNMDDFVFKYQLTYLTDKLLNKLSYLIILLAIALAILSFFIIFKYI